MGIRIQRNTWRKPLQFIDSWLPQPDSPRTGLSAVAQRFVRAGWLRRTSDLPGPTLASTTCHDQPTACSLRTAPVRVVRACVSQVAGARSDNRVVLSGRISDVCAELERLAALEPCPSPVSH